MGGKNLKFFFIEDTVTCDIKTKDVKLTYNMDTIKYISKYTFQILMCWCRDESTLCRDEYVQQHTDDDLQNEENGSQR